ncbi:MAG: hypothetical protein JXR19_07655 [Bacteroidia bacterium]
MRAITILITLFITLNPLFLLAQDTTLSRDYSIGIYNQLDLRNTASNGVTVNRVLHDGFRKHVKPQLSNKLGNISYAIFSFASTYMTMVWSHEFGHSLRAKQVGGNFKIHNGKLPIPYATMHLPSDISYHNEALSVTGGFEVNYLNVRSLQQQFVSEGGLYNEDLAYSFANRMMYTIYTSLIVPIDPEDPDVWINTAGDPVHCILPVFKAYSNNQIIMPDSSVNPDLVSYYQQSAILGTFFNLLDINFYSEVAGAFGNINKKRTPKFLIGDDKNGWTYGTLYNVSPLGYELYLTNYLHLKGNQFMIYGRYGKPFKNNGLGVRWNNMIEGKRLNMAAQLDAWSQDIYDSGLSAEVQSSIRLGSKVSIDATAGYKTKGYVLGKQINAGFTAGVGFTIHSSY